jgi:hypothetical protein
MPLLINGADVATTLAAIGATFRIAKRSGDLTPAIAAPPTRSAPGRFGQVLTGGLAELPPRTIRLECTLEASNATTLETARDALVRTCAGGATVTGPDSGLVTLQLTADGGGNGRFWSGYLATATDVVRRVPTGLAKRADVVLVFTCPDPRAYSTTLTSLTLAHFTKTRPLPLGDVRSAPVFLLPGPISGGVLYWEDSFDTVLASLTIFARTPLLTGETLEIDCGLERFTKIDAGGNRTPVNDWYEAGTFFEIDPAAKNGTPTPCVFTTVDNAPGGWTGTLQYRQAYR